jgi:DnaJ-class molecular chaperone
MSTCQRCGGAGTYRYVDQNGELIARACPDCFGRGRTGPLSSSTAYPQ